MIFLQRKVETDVLLVFSPKLECRKHSRNILKVFYPTGAAHGLTVRCVVTRHGPSRELGPCPKELDGLSCMHQLFPGREPHQTILRGSRRSNVCISIRNRCSCRTVPTTRRSPGLLTVSSSSINGAKLYSGWCLGRLKCCWWFYKSSSAFVRCSRSKTRWCSKREAHLIFVY